MSKLILLVDDDPDDIEITQRALTKSGRDLEVRVAMSGEEAIRLLEQGVQSESGTPQSAIRNPKFVLPDLVFLDLKMRGMSGIDVVLRLRENARLKHIPLVMLTNSTLESDARKACDAGIDCYIHKAFDFDKFGRDIDAQLERWLK